MEAAPGWRGIAGIEPSPDCNILINLLQCGIRVWRGCPLREVRLNDDATGPSRNPAWRHGGGPLPWRPGTTALRNDHIAR